MTKMAEFQRQYKKQTAVPTDGPGTHKSLREIYGEECLSSRRWLELGFAVKPSAKRVGMSMYGGGPTPIFRESDVRYVGKPKKTVAPGWPLIVAPISSKLGLAAYTVRIP